MDRLSDCNKEKEHYHLLSFFPIISSNFSLLVSMKKRGVERHQGVFWGRCGVGWTDSLVRKAGDGVRVKLDSFKAATERRMLLKLPGILNNTSHPLYQGLVQHQSTWSERLIPPNAGESATEGLSCLWESDFVTAHLEVNAFKLFCFCFKLYF